MKTVGCLVSLTLLGAVACSTVPEPSLLVIECGAIQAHGQPSPALVGVEYGTQATAVPVNSVQFTDWNTVEQLSIQQVYGERTETGTVQVTARLTSCTDVPRSLLVRTSFFDPNLAPTEQPSGWKRIYLPARSSAVYSEFSTSSNAANYLIEINAG